MNDNYNYIYRLVCSGELWTSMIAHRLFELSDRKSDHKIAAETDVTFLCFQKVDHPQVTLFISNDNLESLLPWFQHAETDYINKESENCL